MNRDDAEAQANGVLQPLVDAGLQKTWHVKRRALRFAQFFLGGFLVFAASYAVLVGLDVANGRGLDDSHGRGGIIFLLAIGTALHRYRRAREDMAQVERVVAAGRSPAPVMLRDAD